MPTKLERSIEDLFAVLNLDRYPIRDLSTDLAQATIKLLRESLAEKGVLELTEFIAPSARPLLLEDVLMLLPKIRSSSARGTIYADGNNDLLFPEGHPRRLSEPEHLRVLPYDQFPRSSLLRRLFEWDHLLHFLSGITGETLYRYADPLGGLNVTVTTGGEEKGWHFDQTDYGAAIALQPSDEGGEFEVIPFVRSPEGENYEEVIRVLEGDKSRVRQFATRPGNLILFQGRYSLHRVAPVQGTKPRLVAILAYDRKPYTRSSDFLRRSRYGVLNPDS